MSKTTRPERTNSRHYRPHRVTATPRARAQRPRAEPHPRAAHRRPTEPAPRPRAHRLGRRPARPVARPPRLALWAAAMAGGPTAGGGGGRRQTAARPRTLKMYEYEYVLLAMAAAGAAQHAPAGRPRVEEAKRVCVGWLVLSTMQALLVDDLHFFFVCWRCRSTTGQLLPRAAHAGRPWLTRHRARMPTPTQYASRRCTIPPPSSPLFF